MRILVVTGTLRMGGTEQYITRISPILRDLHGIDVDICLLDAAGPLLDVAAAAGLRVFGTRARDRSKWTTAIAAPATVLEVAARIRAGRYALVHSYLFHAEAVGTLAARLAGIERTIISLRAIYPWRRPDGAGNYALESMTNLLAHEVIANSNTVLRDAERTERFLPRRRTVVYNGIDASSYPPADIAMAGRLRLITVGALEDRKGQEFAVIALGAVRDAGIDAELTLVGTGANEVMLKRVVTELGLERYVLFAGLHLDPRPLLRASDLFVLPSRQEGFSNALLEAMASALPIVATDVGGNAEALIDGEGGCIVPPCDAAALANAIISLAGDRTVMRRMGFANRDRVVREFSLSASAANLARWYKNPD